MQLKPNEVPDMIEGEIRRVNVNLSGAAGANTISTFSVDAGNLTAASVSSSGLIGTFLLTASQLGTHQVLCSATLSSGETIKGYIRAKVTGEPCSSSSDGYSD
jgi:hypothetical protein